MTKKKCDGCIYPEITGEHISPCILCYKYYKKNEGDEKIMDYKEEYIKLAKKYEKLHDKLYAKDFFEVEPAGKYTEDSRKFQNGLCVFNNRLGMAYSVTEIVEVLNSLVKNQDLIIRLFDDKIEYLKDDVEIAIKAGISPSKIYNEINRLEELKEEIINVMYND